MEKIIKGQPDGWMNVVRRESKEAPRDGGRAREPVLSLLLSANDMAELLLVTVLTIRRWHKAGVVPVGIPLGGLVRWRREEINAWIRAGSPPQSVWKDMPYQK